MDFFNSPYFSINKKLLKIVGLWPNQGYLDKILIRALFSLLTILFSIPQILSLRVHLGVDIRKVVQATATLLYIINVYLKMFMSIVTERKIERMYHNISQNWKMVEDKEDIKVLLKNSRIGRVLTTAYMFYMFSALIAFITVPMLPLLIDKIVPLNESRPLIFILDGEYLVDPYQHYKKIYVFESLTCIMTVIIFCTADSTYAVCVQQCIGLLEVVKMRLDMTKTTIKKLDVPEIEKVDAAVYNSIIDTIQFHQKAIDFANVLEATYAINFMVILCISVIILSIGSIVMVMNLDRPMEILRYTMIYIGIILHILYLSLPGQQMIDVSESLVNDAYNNKWYEFSLKTQKILKFMMMRCETPCQLTAGGICVMNVANCGAILRTSLSYITVFASMVQ